MFDDWLLEALIVSPIGGCAKERGEELPVDTALVLAQVPVCERFHTRGFGVRVVFLGGRGIGHGS